MITVQLIGDDKLVARLDAMPGRLHDGLARAVTRLGLDLQRKVQEEKLTGQVLKVRSDVLRSSINTEISDAPAAIGASVGTNVFYGRIQEYGVNHPWVIEAKEAYRIATKRRHMLRFVIGGRVFFRRSVRHPPLPERSFLRSALKEMAPDIEAGLREAVKQAIA